MIHYCSIFAGLSSGYQTTSSGVVQAGVSDLPQLTGEDLKMLDAFDQLRPSREGSQFYGSFPPQSSTATNYHGNRAYWCSYASFTPLIFHFKRCFFRHHYIMCHFVSFFCSVFLFSRSWMLVIQQLTSLSNHHPLWYSNSYRVYFQVCRKSIDQLFLC